MTDAPTFDASPCEGVAAGHCVMLVEDAIVYAGPIKGAPDTAGRLVLMCPTDFERFKKHLDRKRH